MQKIHVLRDVDAKFYIIVKDIINLLIQKSTLPDIKN